MAISYSGTDIVRLDEIDGSTAAGLLANIHSALTEAGWLYITIDGGYKYRLRSPQNLFARCRVTSYSDFLGERVSVQFLSDDEARTGYRHQLWCGAGRIFQLWANVCQVFISRPGISDYADTTDGNSVCGGIPWVPNPPGGLDANERPDDCETVLVTNEVWWSCGDRDDGPNSFVRANFRSHYHCFSAWSACHNGDLSLHSGDGSWRYSTLRLLPVTPMENVEDGAWMGWPETKWLVDGSPLYLDPLLAWGSSGGDRHARVRAQVWDAVIVSIDYPIDSERTIDDRLFVNYTHSRYAADRMNSYYCTLHLLEATLLPPAELGNYAY